MKNEVTLFVTSSYVLGGPLSLRIPGERCLDAARFQAKCDPSATVTVLAGNVSWKNSPSRIDG